jgi:hypothetical protein
MDEEHARIAADVFLPAKGTLNAEQRKVIEGVVTTLKGIEDDVAANEWLEESRERIVEELRQLS